MLVRTRQYICFHYIVYHIPAQISIGNLSKFKYKILYIIHIDTRPFALGKMCAVIMTATAVTIVIVVKLEQIGRAHV